MGSLLAAAVFFDAIHIVIAGTELRWKITGRIGEEVFQAIFSILSLAGIVWLSRAYGRAEYVELWGQVQAVRWLALIVMFIRSEVFQAIFSILSLAGIVWLSRAYGRAEYVELWGQVQAVRWLALIVMFIAFF